MTNYELAKLAIMLGGLHSRKRIQKTVHLLQAAGYDCGLDFRLHYYGPYSAELAERIDTMAKSGLLRESTRATPVGTQYDYTFNSDARGSLELFEQTDEGRTAKAKLESFGDLLAMVNAQAPRVLELAATIVAFRQSGSSWLEAVQKTSDFKREPVESLNLQDAAKVAKGVVGDDDG
jgi:uncharacterized protein